MAFLGQRQYFLALACLASKTCEIERGQVVNKQKAAKNLEQINFDIEEAQSFNMHSMRHIRLTSRTFSSRQCLRRLTRRHFLSEAFKCEVRHRTWDVLTGKLASLGNRPFIASRIPGRLELEIVVASAAEGGPREIFLRRRTQVQQGEAR